jgi:hypothetical protein
MKFSSISGDYKGGLIDDMMCSPLRPKMIGGLVFIKHSSCPLNERFILPFINPILLRILGC